MDFAGAVGSPERDDQEQIHNYSLASETLQGQWLSESDGQGQIDGDKRQNCQRGPFWLWSHRLTGAQAGMPEADWVRQLLMFSNQSSKALTLGPTAVQLRQAAAL